MNKKYLNDSIKISISPNEIEVIHKYISVPLLLIKKIDSFVEAAKIIKRVLVILTVKELDNLIFNIAERVNQRNTLPEIQYTLDTLFGKLSTKYNDNIL